MRKHGESGFTLMEMLVVLGIIALIVSFALPKLSHSITKTKITDGVQALAGASAQAESVCASKNAPPADVKALFGEMPSGYQKVFSNNATTCEGFGFGIGPATTDLPTLCIRREGGAWRYAYTLSGNVTADDIPVPPQKLSTNLSCP